MAGRPTKCTPDMIESICGYLRKGHWAESAAVLSGIDEKTYYNWVDAGGEGREPYATFLQSVKIASAMAEDTAIETVNGGNGDAKAGPMWQSAMTFLERRYPHRWARRDPDHALKTKTLELEIETLKAKLKLLEQGQNPDAAHITVVVPDFGKGGSSGQEH
jgi:hypothetical protein